MVQIGQIFMKIAGRDAGKLCVVVDELDDTFVLIDGETRRRKCNIKHLEPVDKTIDIKKKASHDTVAKAFKELGIEFKESKKKESKPRPKKVRKHVAKKAAEPKKESKPKKSGKKESKPASEKKDSKKTSSEKKSSKKEDKKDNK
ncbi:MAG: 50S ribosomal protein L14e [Candidatus Woesearchaeota archaeon]